MITIEGARFLTVRDLADLHGVTVGTARNWRTEGREPVAGLKLGHTVLYRAADAEADVKAHGKRGRK